MGFIVEGLGEVILKVTMALFPLLVVFGLFQHFFLNLPNSRLIKLIKGIAISYVGLILFLQGVYVGLQPAGTEMGTILSEMERTWLVIPIGFALGYVATYAEPAVRIMSIEIDKVSSGTISRGFIVQTLSLGVALFVAIAMVRVLIGFPLRYVLIPGYLFALVLLFFAGRDFIAIAFDSGGVATGPMTVTFVMALAVGLAEGIPGRDPVLDGFGLIALVAMAPIIVMMSVGIIIQYMEEDAS